MSKSIGGIGKDMGLVFARRICALCKKDFIPGETKIKDGDRFYHSECFHKKDVVEAV